MRRQPGGHGAPDGARRRRLWQDRRRHDLVGVPGDSAAAGSWQSVAGLPAAVGGALQDVAVDGSKLVAVGYGAYRGPGLVWTSTDGSAWQPEPSAAALATVPLEALAVGPSGLVAFGDDCSGTTECLANVQAFQSADGSAWKASAPMTTRGEEGVSHAIWTGTQFVAVGRDTQPSSICRGSLDIG